MRLRCEAGPNGTSNDHPDRMPRGRPKQQQADQQPAPLKVKLIPQVVIPHFVPPPNIPRFSEEGDIPEVEAPAENLPLQPETPISPVPTKTTSKPPKKQKTTKPDALDLSIDSIPDLLLEEQSSMPTSSPQLEEVDKEPTSGSEPDVQSAPQQLQPAAPRYFMRGAKQQHNEATDGE